MRGIRIWHLAALALSVPLLMAAVPPGCTGGLNPGFRQAIGQDAGVGMPLPMGFHMVGIFDQTGWPGWLNVNVAGSAFNTTWELGFAALEPTASTWECNLDSITPSGGTLLVPDDSGVVEEVAITYSGIPLMLGQQMKCGELIKLRVVPVVENETSYVIYPPGSTPQTVQGLSYHIFVDVISH